MTHFRIEGTRRFSPCGSALLEAVVKCKEAIMFHGIKDEDLDQDIEVEIFEAIIRHWPQWS